MKGRPLVLLGGGEHARVVIEAVRALDGWKLLGFLDPAECEETSTRFDLPRLGADAEAGGIIAAQPGVRFILGVGAPSNAGVRVGLVARLEGATWATVVHPAAWVAPSARLEPGVFVAAGAVVNSGARIGLHSVINSGAVIEHDVVVGPHTHVGPAAAIGGGAVVAEEAFLGMGCRIRDHVSVGRRARVAMGAVVVADVPADALVAGVPAKPRSVEPK